MESKLTFLFYHYGKIPEYLGNAIEHVRIFNPLAEILFISDGIKKTSKLDCFDIKKANIGDLNSEELDEFRKSYKHLSKYGEKYEKFCFERWFATEVIRKKSPNKTYVMIDSDVAVFGNLANVPLHLPDCAISIAGNCPHLTFIKRSLSGFLKFILEHYKDHEKFKIINNLYYGCSNEGQNINLSDMIFLHLYLNESSEIKNYEKNTNNGFVDTNIHLDEGFEYLQLRRRLRKKIFWKLEKGRAIPYFRRGNEFARALALHFQGPGKRVFHRFNSLDGPPSSLQIWWWNQIFQKRWLANLM